MQTKITSLYFCGDSNPTEEERAEAKELGITAFRNVRLVEESLEKADVVAGKAPTRYAKLKGCKVIPTKLK